MKYFVTIFITLIFFACGNKKVEEQGKEMEIDTTLSIKTVIDSIPNRAPTIYTLPFFETAIHNESFESFYLNLVENCIDKDTSAVLNAIADTLRFSRYECAYGQYINAEADCDGCTRCTKKGMIEGVFAGSNSTQVCERLLVLITNYGIGPLKNNKNYYRWLKLDNAYLNFNFSDWKLGAKYFDYGYLIPKENGIEVKETTSRYSKTIKKLPFDLISYSNEPGMGVVDDNNNSWLEYGNGFIDGDKVLTGFGFTLVIFENTHAGWKITGFIQPPGC